jgi:hypothetical protein
MCDKCGRTKFPMLRRRKLSCTVPPADEIPCLSGTCREMFGTDGGCLAKCPPAIICALDEAQSTRLRLLLQPRRNIHAELRGCGAAIDVACGGLPACRSDCPVPWLPVDEPEACFRRLVFRIGRGCGGLGGRSDGSWWRCSSCRFSDVAPGIGGVVEVGVGNCRACTGLCLVAASSFGSAGGYRGGADVPGSGSGQTLIEFIKVPDTWRARLLPLRPISSITCRT